MRHKPVRAKFESTAVTESAPEHINLRIGDFYFLQYTFCMQYKSSSYFFLVFIVLAASAFAALPTVKKSFTHFSEEYIESEMVQIQSHMFFYKIEEGSFHGFCQDRPVLTLGYEILSETDSGLSCLLAQDFSGVALFFGLSSGETYCVDASGFSGVLSFSPRNLSGHCIQ